MTLTYGVAIVPGVARGEIVNVARAVGPRAASNDASASLRVVDDLFRDEAFLVGRVAFGSCGAAGAAEADGFGGARVYLEDGRYAVSDSAGRFHFEGVRVGTHVVQLDLDSLPATVELAPCASDSRFAGTAFSRFVTLAPGELGRVDFYLLSKSGRSSTSRARGDWVRRAACAAGAAVRSPARASRYSRASRRRRRCPRSTSIRSRRVRLAMAARGSLARDPEREGGGAARGRGAVELSLNGRPVSMLSFDGTATAATTGASLSRWRGLDLVDGPNLLAADVVDAAGRVRRFERALHFAGPPVRGELVAAGSRLAADGNERPVLAVRFVDRWGRPARPGSLAEFRVDAPYRSWFDVERLRENPVLTTRERAPTLKVGADGVARIELEPTTRAGEAVVTVRYADGREQTLRAWLEPARARLGARRARGGHDRLRQGARRARCRIVGRLRRRLLRRRAARVLREGQVKGSLLTVALDSDGGATPRRDARRHDRSRQVLHGVRRRDRAALRRRDARPPVLEARAPHVHGDGRRFRDRAHGYRARPLQPQPHGLQVGAPRRARELLRVREREPTRRS